jgi:hypothetical protein
MRKPDFIVIGQGKAGTSLIYRVLEKNPHVGLSARKELHYFSAHYDRGLDWYLSQFAHNPADVPMLGEVSPSYLAVERLERLARDLGRQTKIIVTLRRPIERAYARYLQDLCARQPVDSFERIAQALPNWLQGQLRALHRAHELFDHLLVLFFERDIACETPSYEQKILSFLGLEGRTYAQDLEQDRVNATVFPQYLSTGDAPLRLRLSGDLYEIPPNRLLFCGQRRNSFEITEPSKGQLIQALHAQSSWTRSIAVQDYARLHDQAVAPFQAGLETEFNWDLSHWTGPARAIQYPLAPPFPRFKVSPC